MCEKGIPEMSHMVLVSLVASAVLVVLNPHVVLDLLDKVIDWFPLFDGPHVYNQVWGPLVVGPAALGCLVWLFPSPLVTLQFVFQPL